MYSLFADLVVVVHLAFVAFAVAGGLLVARWPWLAWLHLPAVAWAAAVELAGWTCPLTPLEDHWRELAGERAATGDFISRLLLPLLYPAALTRELQFLLGAGVLALNLAIYSWLWHRRR